MEEKIKRVINNFKEKNPNASINKILDRGICCAENNPVNEILFTGINPYYDEARKGDDISFKLINADGKLRWRIIKDLLGDLLPKTAYLDLFPLKETISESLGRLMPMELKVDLLKITQEEIERINPKLIIVGNRTSRAYWGAMQKYPWMGYKFEQIESPLKKNVPVYRIAGLREDEDKISLETDLQGTVVIFSSLSPYYPKEKTLSNEDVECLYEFASEVEYNSIL